MSWELRHIRTLAAIADHGSLTDAAAVLGVSQAQVSRTLKSLEDAWGVLLVRRQPRDAVLTAEGQRAVTKGRRLLQLAEQMEAEARGQGRLRIGYAWAGAGRHTTALHRRWKKLHPQGELAFVRASGVLAGLGEGLVDASITRTEPDPGRFSSVLVGTERRVACFPEDDPWARRRVLRMRDFVGRPLIADTRAGTTTPELWPEGRRPYVLADVSSVDEWLDAIAAGRGLGVSSEATAHQHQRSGIKYKVITDAPPLGVWITWHRGEDTASLAELRALLAELYAAA